MSDRSNEGDAAQKHAFPRKSEERVDPAPWMREGAREARAAVFRGQRAAAEPSVPSFAAPSKSANEPAPAVAPVASPPPAREPDAETLLRAAGPIEEFRRLVSEPLPARTPSTPPPFDVLGNEPKIPLPPRPPSVYPRPPSGGYAPPTSLRPPSGGYSRPPTGGFQRPSLVPPSTVNDPEMLKLRAEFAEGVVRLALSERRAFLEAEESMLRLSVEIARALIDDELSARPELHRSLVRAAIAAIGDDGPVRVRASRNAYEAILDHFGTAKLDVEGARVDISLDAALDGLGVVVDRGEARVDGRVEARLEEVRRALVEARRQKRISEVAA